jgi:DNA-binding NarL/FixJ family response regulator
VVKFFSILPADRTSQVVGAGLIMSLDQKRIVVLESDQLLNAGVQSFLSSQGYQQVHGVATRNEETMVLEIERLHPDVIIMDEDNREANLALLVPYMAGDRAIRTIIMNLHNNQISIYEQRQVLVQQLSDFLDVL